MKRVLLFVCTIGCGCFGEVPAEAGSDDESSSSSSTSATLPPLVTTVSGSGSEDSSSTTVSDPQESTTSELESESSSSSETGEPLTDFALRFNGSSQAQTEPLTWEHDDFTVETWIDILDEDEALGVIFDGTNTSFTTGWVLYFHNEWRSVVFSFFDDAHMNNVVMGPAIDEIGSGWHHLAATKAGDSILIHIDGVVVTTATVDPSVADGETLWTVGGNAVDNPDFRLRHTVVDDVRVSSIARYDDDFDPPAVVAFDDDTLLLLTLDEGSGNMASDELGTMFQIAQPAWVPGHSDL